MQLPPLSDRYFFPIMFTTLSMWSIVKELGNNKATNIGWVQPGIKPRSLGWWCSMLTTTQKSAYLELQLFTIITFQYSQWCLVLKGNSEIMLYLFFDHLLIYYVPAPSPFEGEGVYYLQMLVRQFTSAFLFRNLSPISPTSLKLHISWLPLLCGKPLLLFEMVDQRSRSLWNKVKSCFCSIAWYSACRLHWMMIELIL